MTFALRYWREIGLGIAAMLLVTVTALWRTTDAKLDQCNREAVVWARTSKTQEGSIVTLQDALDRKNAESDARAAELTAARQREAQAAAQMDARAATARSQIETLNRLAKSGNSVCGVTDELREALRGL